VQYTLRDYQQEATDAGLAYLLNKSSKFKRRNGMIVAPTGSGKSLLIASIATQLPEASIVFQPTREILQQNAAKLAHYGFPAAVFSASMGRRERGRITLATIGSVAAVPAAFEHVSYLLIDECHQAVNPKGGQYTDFIEGLPEHVRVMGFTATPYRMQTNSFGTQLRFLTRSIPRLFNDMVHETPIARLVEAGYWCPLRYDDGHQVVRRERLVLNTKGTDYTDGSVQMEFNEIGFVGKLCDVVAAKMAQGRKHILVFTRFTDEARRVAAQFPGCAFVTGETPDHERDAVVQGFSTGRIPMVANVGVLGVGFDAPVIDCVVLGRPTVSLATYYQQVGRAVRPHASKAWADIVDMCGLTRLFGRVEDLQLRTGGRYGREWTVCSGERALTDVYFSERDSEPEAPLSPEEVKKKKAADFWRRKHRFGRRR